MAAKRMIAKELLESDEYERLPVQAKLLYLHMTVYADDDGIVSNPNHLMRATGATQGDAQSLLNSGLVIQMDAKIVIIRDWLRYNRIQPSRYKASVYQDIAAQLRVTNGCYYICRHDVDMMSRSIGKNSKEKNIKDEGTSIDKWRNEQFEKNVNPKNHNTGFMTSNTDIAAIEKYLISN